MIALKFDFKPVLSTVMWVLIFMLMAFILFGAGLMVGYGVLGDGNPSPCLQQADLGTYL